MTNPDNLRRIDFTEGCYTSGGEMVQGTENDVTILFNINTISIEEVNQLILNSSYERDPRIVVTTPIQADNLKDKI